MSLLDNVVFARRPKLILTTGQILEEPDRVSDQIPEDLRIANPNVQGYRVQHITLVDQGVAFFHPTVESWMK